MIIGLTGSYCAGKDMIAEYLVAARGFIHYSLSDELRAELQRQGIAPVRENLIRIGTELRASRGNGVLAHLVCSRFVAGQAYVITSIRHPAEIEALRSRPDFILINVDAPAELRFQRMRNRNRPGDPETIEHFREMEQKEFQTQGSGQQLAACAALAGLTFMNDQNSLTALHERIESLLSRLRKDIP
jgi:dephospho-CoA kinase